MQKVSGHFIGSNAATVNLNLGFVPSRFHAWSALAGTPLIYDWWKILADLATTGQYGMQDNGAGVKSACATAAAGISAYNTEAPAVEVPAPSGTGYTKVAMSSVADFVAGAAQPTARSISVVGTLYRPKGTGTVPVHTHLIYECTVSTTTLGTEPTWPTKPGDTVTDSANNTFICREERLCTIGGKGVTIGASIMVDSGIWAYEAELHEDVVSKGDAQGIDPL